MPYKLPLWNCLERIQNSIKNIQRKSLLKNKVNCHLEYWNNHRWLPDIKMLFVYVTVNVKTDRQVQQSCVANKSDRFCVYVYYNGLRTTFYIKKSAHIKFKNNSHGLWMSHYGHHCKMHSQVNRRLIPVHTV